MFHVWWSARIYLRKILGLSCKKDNHTLCGMMFFHFGLELVVASSVWKLYQWVKIGLGSGVLKSPSHSPRKPADQLKSAASLSQKLSRFTYSIELNSHWWHYSAAGCQFSKSFAATKYKKNKRFYPAKRVKLTVEASAKSLQPIHFVHDSIPKSLGKSS